MERLLRGNTMKNAAINTVKKLWADESGQGAAEYILLLVVVVGIVMLFKDRIAGIVNSKLSDLQAGTEGVTTSL
jgi:Flp pilus assembly pilin Flp